MPSFISISRGISLINTEGKAYVMVILNLVRTYLEAQLLDAQQGFRQQRGTPDALLVDNIGAFYMHDKACNSSTPSLRYAAGRGGRPRGCSSCTLPCLPACMDSAGSISCAC